MLQATIMNRDINAYMTLFIKGVTVNKLGTLKYADKNSCVFSFFPSHHSIHLLTMMNETFNTLNNIIYNSAITYEEANTIWTKFLEDLNESTYGLFVDSPITIPFTYEIPRWYGKDRTTEVHGLIAQAKVYLDNMQKILDDVHAKFIKLKAKPSATDTDSKKAATKAALKVAQQVVNAVNRTPQTGGGAGSAEEPVEEPAKEPLEEKPKAKTKAEKEAEYIALLLQHSEDFDPSKWAEVIKSAETHFNGLPNEIKTLTDELAESFNFAKRGRLNKLQKKLEEYPAYIKGLKDNCSSKQNDYNDGYQSKYTEFKKKVTDICDSQENLEILKSDGVAPNNIEEKIIKPLSAPEALIHFARSPALRNKLSKFVAQAQSDVNRKRLNKATYQANVDKGHALLRRIQTVSDDNRDYFVTDIWH